MKQKTETLFAVTAPGLESVCAVELAALGMDEIQPEAGGVLFRGGLRELYLANLWLRTASRVLVRFGEFGCRDFPGLYRKAVRLPWGRYLKPGTRLRIRATCRRSRLGHTGRIAETLEQAMEKALGAATQTGCDKEQLLLVTVEDDLCRLSLDSSGALLHRRGYRQDIGAAPLRETLAAGILMLLGWRGETPLFDPMCGSGTFLVEGALLALNRPPGAARTFAFMDWPRYRPGLWQALLMEAQRQGREACPVLAGGDRDPAVLEAARRNADRAGVGHCLILRQAEAGDWIPSVDRPGLAICNPPYGTRLGRGEEKAIGRTLDRLYEKIPRPWQRVFLAADPGPADAMVLPLRRLAALQNGGIRAALLEVT